MDAHEVLHVWFVFGCLGSLGSMSNERGLKKGDG